MLAQLRQSVVWRTFRYACCQVLKLASADGWRAKFADLPPPQQPMVLFIIPLIAKQKTKNWETVCDNLAMTLRSLDAQTSGAWKAIVCGQDRPAFLEDSDQTIFLPFPVGSGKSYDKRKKLEYMLSSPEAAACKDAYVFLLDADDVLAPELVAYVVADNNGHGYYMDKGYLWDASDDRMSFLDPDAVISAQQVPFYKLCGSSALFRVAFENGMKSTLPLLKRTSHTKVVEEAADFGLSLAPLPMFGCVYTLAHGENMQERRNNLGGKLEFVRNAGLAPDAVTKIKTDFGLSS